MKNDCHAYTPVSIGLHWLVALAVVLAMLSGVWMLTLEFSPLKLRLFVWHDWLGVLILLLTVLRLFWRLRHRVPKVLARSALERAVARAAHLTLYALLILVPLQGWLYRSASGIQIVFLEWIELPLLMANSPSLAPLLRQVHAWMGYALLGLIALHVGAALKHHLFDRDATLTRMIPWLKGD